MITANEPIQKMLDRHEQTLFGPQGDNGLNGDMKVINAKLEEFDGLKKKAIAVLAAVQLGLGAAFHFIPKWFEKN